MFGKDALSNDQCFNAAGRANCQKFTSNPVQPQKNWSVKNQK